jgi:hypothetical protein
MVVVVVVVVEEEKEAVHSMTGEITWLKCAGLNVTGHLQVCTVYAAALNDVPELQGAKDRGLLPINTPGISGRVRQSWEDKALCGSTRIFQRTPVIKTVV